MDKKTFENFRKSMAWHGHRCVEDFTDLDWKLIDIAVGIIEKYQSPIEYRLFRRELAKAANIRLSDAGWYITNVLTFDPIIEGEIVHVLAIGSGARRGHVISITDAFKKYYDERKTYRKKTPGGG